MLPDKGKLLVSDTVVLPRVSLATQYIVITNNWPQSPSQPPMDQGRVRDLL